MNGLRRSLAMVCSVFLVFAVGCGTSGDEETPFCPSISDDATWNSYGHFVMNDSGNDQTARRIVSECDWHVYSGHNGGYGDTLQVASRDEGVVLVWAFNDLYGVSLVEGWTGSAQGVTIGMSEEEFVAKHPEFTRQPDHSYYLFYDDGDPDRIQVFFDDFGFVSEVYIGWYYRR